MITEGLLGRLGRRSGRDPLAGRDPRGRDPRAAAPRAAVRRHSRRLVRRRFGWRPGPRFVAAVIAVVASLGGVWMWLRDSSLVAIKHVTVIGATGPDARQIRAALGTAARSMTTLDVQLGRLHTAVEPYPVVKSLRVSTQFPHGMRIDVIEQIPVAAVMIGDRPVAVAADGTLLHDARTSGSLPVIALGAPPGGSRITDASTLQVIAMLASAPYQLIPKISSAMHTSAHGLVAQLRSGPSIYFGSAQQLDAKWLAATAVLADSRSDGAQYIDVSDPRRAAAGAVAPAGSSTSASSAPTNGAGTAAASGTTGASAGTPAGSTGASTGTPVGTTGASAATAADSTGTAAATPAGTSGTGVIAP
jgi:cell division protein FtsQ